jgi:DNA-binding SARP family transcriptional activator
VTVSGVQFRLLGPIEILIAGRPIPLDVGHRTRGLLALLLLAPNRVVTFDRIESALWGQYPPQSARSMVQTHMWRVRRLLQDASPTNILTSLHGYQIEVDESRIDVDEARTLLDASIDLEPDDAVYVLRNAEKLWRGPVLGEVASLSETFEQAAAELTDLRVDIIERRITAELSLGKHREATTDLARLVAEYPLRERLVELLMIALYRTGDRERALDTYRQTQQYFLNELGIDPGAQLREIHRRILAENPRLLDEMPPPRPPRAVLTTTTDDTQTTDFDDLSDELEPTEPPTGRGGVGTIERTTVGTVPISVYLSDGSTHDAVESAVEDALRAAGVAVLRRDDPVIGSWFRRMWGSSAGRDLAATAAHAADSRLVLGQDAQVTATLMQHVPALVESIKHIDEAVIRLGAVLVVKVGGRVAVNQLTAAQQLRLDHEPHLALAPHDILAALRLNHDQPPQLNGHPPDS